MIVKYSKKFPYAPYLNEDIGFEMDIGDIIGETEVLGYLSDLKAMAEKFHKEANPQLQYEAPFVYSQDPLPSTGTIPHVQPPIINLASESLPEENRILQLMGDINTCTELKVLQSYKLMVKGNPQLQHAYDVKLQALWMSDDSENKLKQLQ